LLREQKLRELAPELADIKRRHADKPDLLFAATQRLHEAHGVPLFDRFSIMRLWSDLGTFDLYSATKKLDIAERVHDCIGRLLADFVITAAKPEEPPVNGSR
jgi:hypothetical protein